MADKYVIIILHIVFIWMCDLSLIVGFVLLALCVMCCTLLDWVSWKWRNPL